MNDQPSLFFQQNKTYSVHELSNHIKQLFERDSTLQNVTVEGEISNFRPATSGHWYFSLKDEKSQIRCVMWRTQATQLTFQPKDGDRVWISGKVSVYEQRGEYQIYANTMQPAGLGDLYVQFEMLKAKLEAEGLFDPTRKQPLPVFPTRIGVVTSPTTAAFQDVLNVLRRRFPLASVVISPTLVQGDEAAPQICKALEHLNERDDIDVILMVRGGGSIEDLWCFNDEDLARAVAASRLPIVTGVGHEIDFTLVDFTADYRAPTPSAAAEVIVPEIRELFMGVDALYERAENVIRLKITNSHQDVALQRRTLQHLSPLGDIRNALQRVDDLSLRLRRGISAQLTFAKQQLQNRHMALDAASPQAILQRGYAIVTRAGDGKQLTDAIDANEGTSIDIQLQRGVLRATVKKREIPDEG